MGNEFRVNTFTQGQQAAPDIVRLADGGYMIVWHAYIQSQSAYAIGGQRYNANGSPSSNELVFDFAAGKNARNPRIDQLADGGFVVTYTANTGNLLNPKTIEVIVVNADYTVRSTTQRVDTVTAFESRSPETIALADGGFMVFFVADTTNNNNKTEEIYARVYNANGTARGANFLVNTIAGSGEQLFPEAVTLANGNILVVWHSEGTLPTLNSSFPSNEIRGTVFSSSGIALVSDIPLVDAFGSIGDGARDFNVVSLTTGGFAISFYAVTLGVGGAATTFDLKLQYFSSTGTATSAPLNAVASTVGSPDHSAMVQLATGEILLVWDVTSENASTFFKDVRAQLFDINGIALGSVFQVAQDRLNDQDNPRVIALVGGGFVITYQSEQADGDREGIAAREFGRGTPGADVLNVDESGYLAGLDGDDVLTGNVLANVLNGGSGNDVLVGGAGADKLDGGAGADIADYSTFAGGAGIYADLLNGFVQDNSGAYDRVVGIETIYGTDALRAGSLSDVMLGNNESNSFFGFGGQDYIVGAGGDDYIDVGAGMTNIAIGGTGNDTIVGGADNDFLYGNAGNDTLVGGAGADWLFGGDFSSAPVTGSDTLSGGTGNDVLAVGSQGGNFALADGGAGNDIIYGGALANDIIRGGTGNDYMYGNTGADTYRFEAGDLVSGDQDSIFMNTTGDSLSFAFSYQNQISIAAGVNAGVSGVYLAHTASTWIAWLPYQTIASVSAEIVFV